MSKKVLSLALVVVMLMSMFAFSTSAADLTTGQIGIKLVTDATVGMAAGKTVTVKAYYTAPADLDLTSYLHNMSQIGIAYTDAYELDTASPNTTDSYDARAWGASYADFFTETSIVNTKTALYTAVANKFTDNDKAKGWDKYLLVAQSPNTENGMTSTTGYALDLDCEVFTLTFKTTREVTADDTFGVPEASVTMAQTKMYYVVDGANKQYAKNVSTIVLADATAAPTAAAAKAPVYWVANQVRPNGDAMDIGIKAGFNTADINIAFNEAGTSTNVMTVGANLKVNGADAGTGTSRFVYKISDTEYQYRVILEDIAKDSTDVYTVELFVEVKDEATGKTTIITGDTVTVKAADVVGKLPA